MIGYRGALIKNRCYTVIISDITSAGFGVGIINDFPIWIPNSAPGDVLRIKLIKLLTTHGFGRIESIITPSDQRVQPPCSIAYQCGGCQLQHLSYGSQIQWKNTWVEQQLKAHQLPYTSQPVIASDSMALAYRNKAQYSIRRINGEVIIGLFAPRSQRIISISDCAIQSAITNQIISHVRDWLTAYHVPIYDPEETSDGICGVIVRISESTQQAIVALVSTQDELPNQTECITQLTRHPAVVGIGLSVNKNPLWEMLGQRNHWLWGVTQITDQHMGLSVSISIDSFFQVNSFQLSALWACVCELIGDQTDAIIWDLYCGTGSMSLMLSKRYREVVGIEIDPSAIEDARASALANECHNVTFIEGAVESELTTLTSHVDVVIIDPPRRGISPGVIDALCLAKPRQIIYISCSLSTAIRDVMLFQAKGYQLTTTRVLDMFPQTVHIETIHCLTLAD